MGFGSGEKKLPRQEQALRREKGIQVERLSGGSALTGDRSVLGLLGERGGGSLAVRPRRLRGGGK